MFDIIILIVGDSMIENNSIVICSNSYKNKLLKETNKLINVKYYNIDEFIKLYYFDYDYNSVLYIIKKYKVKYDVALLYLKNLIYIEDKIYNIEKLDFLVNLKKELIDNNLLIFNDNFKNYIKDKNIIIYNYNLSKFERYLLNNLNIKEIDTNLEDYSPTIYEFNTMYDEISYVAHFISELIYKGVDINKIKLTNISNDYINDINKIFEFYNLKINKFNNIPIISNIVGSTFYNNIYGGIEYSIESINKYKNTDTYNKIISICNKYVMLDNLDDKKLLIEYDLNHTYIKSNIYNNSIEVVDYMNYSFTDEYVFMLGFNQGIIPKLYKDEDYISDKIKLSYMDNTIEKNIFTKKNTIKSIKNIKNLTITYKLKSDFNTFYPSNLIDDLGVEVKHIKKDYNKSFSVINDSIMLTSYLDNLIKYGEKSDDLSILYSNYNIPYNTYSHIFTGIYKDKINKYIKSLDSFNLSYSSMDNYNRCSFRFYIDKILNLKKDINKFSVLLGNIYHHILELSIKSNIDVEKEVNNYIKDNNIELTNSNKFFIRRVINNLIYLIDKLKYQKSFSKLNNVETEKFIKINLKDNINFVGFIDKIVYDTVGDILVAAIIDYKTYVKKPSLKYINEGIGLQLPTYMLLSKYAYKDIRFVGFYLQNIILDNKSDDDKINSLKLIGYTNTDKDILELFDCNYMDSSVINGIKINKDGTFSSNSMKHMLNDEKIDNIIKLTQDKIYETLNNILDSKFDINPKYDNGNIGCEFCEYKDLCFMKEYDFKRIISNKDYEEE